MATGTIMPSPVQTILDANGNPVSGALITTYLAGTSTLATTYTDVTLLVANTNPIVASSAGRFTAFLTPGASYKFVVTTAASVAVWTADNIATVPPSNISLDVTGVAGEAITAGQTVYLSDGSGSKVAGQWYKGDATNPYSSTLPQVGMAPAAISSGASGTLRLSGQVTGLSGLTVGTSYYVSGTAGSTTSTAPANRRFLGVADTTSSLILTPNQSIDWTTLTTTSTGAQNDFAPGLVRNTVIRCNNATLLTISGFGPGYDGQRVVFESVGAGQVDLLHQSGSSSVTNRMINFATVGITSLAAGAGMAEYLYDGTTARWRLVHHTQGAWITPAYAGGNFTTSGAGGWTVASGDVTSYAYVLHGRSLTVTFDLDTTTVTAATGTTMKIAIPASHTAAKTLYVAAGFIGDNSTTQTLGSTHVTAAGTTIDVLRFDAGNFTASVDGTYIRGQITFEVN